MPISSRFAIDYPLGTEVPDIDGDITKVVNAVEALSAQFGQGTLAARPVSTPGSPGKQGRFYVVTSGTGLNQLHYDTGTGWIHLNPDQTPADGSITLAKLAPNSVDASKVIDESITSNEILDGTVRWYELGNDLKPTAGAGAGSETLRSLGTGAHQALPGNHPTATPVSPLYAGNYANGQGWGHIVPVTGTYAIEWGGAQMFSDSQGDSAFLYCSHFGAVVAFANVGDSGGSALGTVFMGGGTQVNFSCSASPGAGVNHCWSKLTRYA